MILMELHNLVVRQAIVDGEGLENLAVKAAHACVCGYPDITFFILKCVITGVAGQAVFCVKMFNKCSLTKTVTADQQKTAEQILAQDIIYHLKSGCKI